MNGKRNRASLLMRLTFTTKLQDFGDQLEAACFDTLNDGIATKDLVNLMEGVEAKAVNSAGFIAAIRERLEKRLG